MTPNQPVGPPPQRPSEAEYWKADPNAPRCDHPRIQLRRLTQRNGVAVGRTQCLTCGANVGGVNKSDISDFDALPAFDEALQAAWRERSERYHRERRERWEAAQSSHDAAWRAWYDAYLKSRQWAAKRKQVLVRDRAVCQGCLVNHATQIHHLTYDRVGDELLFDLVAVCDECHARCHPEARP